MSNNELKHLPGEDPGCAGGLIIFCYVSEFSIIYLVK